MSIKKSTFIFILAMLLCLPSLRVQAQAPSVTIHQLGLSYGDAALYVIIDTTRGSAFAPSHWDTTVILIDAQLQYRAVQKYLFGYMDSILRWLHRPIVDYVVLSHVHIDHYGSMTAVMDSLRVHRDSVTKVFDRFHLTGALYPYINMPKQGKTALAYKNYMQTKSTAGRFAWVSIQPGGNLLQDKNLVNFSMTCLSANGRCMNGTGYDSIFIPKVGAGKYEPKNENDLSYSFLLSFGAFNYYTGGDLGGDESSDYADGETPIAQYLRRTKPAGFHLCAFKVDHHGSEHSTNDTLVKLLNPTLAVVPAGLHSFSGTTLPTDAAMGKLRAINDSIRYTFIPNNPSANVNNWKLGYLQDVVLSITGVPASGANVTMNVSLRRRDKDSRRLDGTIVNQVITCTKTHN